jgi:hypothetical protein
VVVQCGYCGLTGGPCRHVSCADSQARIYQGEPYNRNEARAHQEVIKLGDTVAADDIANVAMALYLLQHERPARFPAVELDFSQVGPRIIYGMAGAAFERDAYAVPGFERHREGIKKVFGAMTHADAPLASFPKKTKDLFPASMKIADVCDAVQRHHPAIADRFYTGVGMAAMFTESQIMVSALLRMKEMNITALPVHDAVIVAGSTAAAAEAFMLDVFHQHTGVQGSVSLVQ